MGRKREGTVIETQEELQTLLHRYRETTYQPRLEFLLALKAQPEAKAEVLMGIVGHSERTIRRWWKTYREGGLAALLEMSNLQAIIAEPMSSYIEADAIPLMTFLNALPSSCNPPEWRASVESALAAYLTDVERVAIEINDDLLRETNPHIDPDAPADIILPVVEDGVELGIVHCYAAHDYEGTLDEALVQLDELDTFLGFLFTDAVARARVVMQTAEGFQELTLTDQLIAMLTPREQDVLLQRLRGATYAEAARELSISEESVRKCVKAIYRKTNTSSVAELFVHYFASMPVGAQG